VSGSTTTRAAPTRLVAFSMMARSLVKEITRSPPLASATVESATILSVSAPAVSRRGLMVSPSPSSAESKTTPAGSHGWPSGSSRPALTRAAISIVTTLLPSPGSPSSTASFPRGRRPGQSHSTRSGSTSDKSLPTGDACSKMLVSGRPETPPMYPFARFSALIVDVSIVVSRFLVPLSTEEARASLTLRPKVRPGASCTSRGSHG
jgi:hypothetical protein